MQSTRNLQKLSAADDVADALAAIILHSMPEAANLPSEAELAQQYGVSRLTIREALKLLAGRGLVDLGRGRRARSRRPDGTAISDYLTSVITSDGRGYYDLMEIRFGLEPLAAGLAARRISRAGLNTLKQTLSGMREAWNPGQGSTDIDRFHSCDLHFHETIANASGNRALNAIFEGLAPPLFASFASSGQGQRQRGHTREVTIQAHQAIHDAIAAGNSAAAENAMRRHLENTRVDITFIARDSRSA